MVAVAAAGGAGRTVAAAGVGATEVAADTLVGTLAGAAATAARAAAATVARAAATMTAAVSSDTQQPGCQARLPWAIPDVGWGEPALDNNSSFAGLRGGQSSER